MFAVWLQLILSQLQLILSQLTFSVANNSGSEDSCLQVGAFMFAVRYIYAEVLDFLLHSPTKNEIIAFKVSPQAQERLRTLLEKNRESALTPLRNGGVRYISTARTFDDITQSTRSQRHQLNVFK